MTATENLETRARTLTEALDKEGSQPSVSQMVRREMAIVLERVDRFRDLHEQLEISLLRAECYVESDLLKLDDYRMRQFSHLFKERDKLKSKLLVIESERRKLHLSREQELQTLFDRLLDLINKQEHLNF